MMRLDPPDNREVDYSKTRNNVTNWFDTEYIASIRDWQTSRRFPALE